MNTNRIATIVVGFVLGTTTGAFAQHRDIVVDRFDPRVAEVERRIDPLDVVAQTERIAANVPPAFETGRMSTSGDYESYVQAYQLYLAQLSVFNQTSKREIEKPKKVEKKGEKTSVANVMRTISGGLALADQGLDVYGHALELQSFKNSMIQR